MAHDLAALEAQRAADEELDHESLIDELFADQIGAANLIVLSKADMLDETVGKARAAVETQPLNRRRSFLYPAAAPMDAILGLDMESRRMRGPSIRIITTITTMMMTMTTTMATMTTIIIMTMAGEFASHVIELGAVDDAEAFQAEIAAIASAYGVLRAKAASVSPVRRCPLLFRRSADALTAISRVMRGGRRRLVVIGMAGLDAGATAARLGGTVIETHASS